MNVLILGSGGREHALAWKISQSRILGKLYVSPGNAGTKFSGSNIDLDINDFDAVGRFCLEGGIDLVVVGPEEPLVRGIRDHFCSRPELGRIMVTGPGKAGAMLEGSKDFAKEFMKRHSIPTAGFMTITRENIDEGLRFLAGLSAPYVLKADGLAAGKGVVILDDRNEAEKELVSMLEGKFGTASSKVVIEEYLSGIELSVFVLTDGRNYLLLPEAKDYKRIGENDTGPNTGGMGSVSPVPFADRAFMDKVEERIIKPTVKGLQSEGIDYRGFIFFGLINVNGEPYVIEYNVRLGDPETEAILPRIGNDLLELLVATEKQELGNQTIDIDPRAAATIMLVSGGYPGTYKKGLEITGLTDKGSGTRSGSGTETILFHAGTKLHEGKVLTNGGRVIAVSSVAATMKEALARSYQAASQIRFEGLYYRKDLGKDIL